MSDVRLPTDPSPDPSLQLAFVSILPRIELHARIYFRGVACQHQQADAIGETVALAWKWFVELARRGKDAAGFVTVLAAYAARAVRSGRRACGQEKARDVLSAVAQRRHGFRVEALPTSTRTPFEDLYAHPGGQRAPDALEERLRDNTITPPPEQAAFRIDFRRWRLGHTDRDRRLIDALMAGERTMDVAPRFGLSPSRISQMRREFYRDWLQFHGDLDEGGQTPAETGRRQPCPG